LVEEGLAKPKEPAVFGRGGSGSAAAGFPKPNAGGALLLGCPKPNEGLGSSSLAPNAGGFDVVPPKENGDATDVVEVALWGCPNGGAEAPKVKPSEAPVLRVGLTSLTLGVTSRVGLWSIPILSSSWPTLGGVTGREPNEKVLLASVGVLAPKEKPVDAGAGDGAD